MSNRNASEVPIDISKSVQLILQNVSELSELTLQLKKETTNGEAYLNSLLDLLFQAEKKVSSLDQCVECLIFIAKKLVQLLLQIVPAKDPNFKSLESEVGKLLNILDSIKEEQYSDSKWLQIDLGTNLKDKVSTKCVTDEKYPEHCSRESLLDTGNVKVLPTVHENVFTGVYGRSHTLSSSSLKNLRKIKKCLRQLEDEDDSKETDDDKQHKSCMKVECKCEGCALESQNGEFLSPLTPATNPVQSVSHIQEELSQQKDL